MTDKLSIGLEKCPNCKAAPAVFVEVWSHATRTFYPTDEGLPGTEALHTEGEPTQVECFCSHCRIKWVVEGVTSIEELR